MEVMSEINKVKEQQIVNNIMMRYLKRNGYDDAGAAAFIAVADIKRIFS
jgi:hypothetical protein